MHASGKGGGPGTSNTKSSGEEKEPGEETGKESLAGGTEAKKWHPGGLQGGHVTTVLLLPKWPGTWHLRGRLEESSFGLGRG